MDAGHGLDGGEIIAAVETGGSAIVGHTQAGNLQRCFKIEQFTSGKPGGGIQELLIHLLDGKNLRGCLGFLPTAAQQQPQHQNPCQTRFLHTPAPF